MKISKNRTFENREIFGFFKIFGKNIFFEKKSIEKIVFRNFLFYTTSGYDVRTQYTTQRIRLQQVWVGLKNRHRKKLGFWIFREKSSTLVKNRT